MTKIYKNTVKKEAYSNCVKPFFVSSPQIVTPILGDITLIVSENFRKFYIVTVDKLRGFIYYSENCPTTPFPFRHLLYSFWCPDFYKDVLISIVSKEGLTFDAVNLSNLFTLVRCYLIPTKVVKIRCPKMNFTLMVVTLLVSVRLK